MSITDLHTKISNAVIDASMAQMEQFSKMAQQGEAVSKVMLDQAQANRSQGMEMAQEWSNFFSEMSKENQRQVQNLVNSAVRLSMDSYKTAQQQTIEQLTQQVELLSRQVELLTAGKN